MSDDEDYNVTLMQATRNPDVNQHVRKLLAQYCPTMADFDAFCLDYFPQVQQRFTAGMDRLSRENLLLELIGAKSLLSALKNSPKIDNATVPITRKFVLILAGIVTVILTGLLSLKYAQYINNVNNSKRNVVAAPNPSHTAHSVQPDMSAMIVSPSINNGTINRGSIKTQNNSPVYIQGNDRGVVINEGNIVTGNGSAVHVGGSNK